MAGRRSRFAAQSSPDIVVLDLGLPDLDGLDVIRGLRGWSKVPIIVLSGRSQGVSKVDALDAGADDYVTKPFNVDELLARLRAVTRRAPTGSDEVQAIIGDVKVELPGRRLSARIADSGPPDVRLTPTEWQLLEVLIRNPGRLVTQREMLRLDRPRRRRRPEPLSSAVHEPAAAQARARSCAAALPDDRARDGLPLPAVRRALPAGSNALTAA